MYDLSKNMFTDLSNTVIIDSWILKLYRFCNGQRAVLECGRLQGRIQDFKLGGALNKIAIIFGVFRVKNHDFTPKNDIFSNFRGVGGGSWVWVPIGSYQRLKLVCVASPLSTQHYEVRAKTCWLGIRIMSTMDCCFSELELYKSSSVCWSRTKRTSFSSHQKCNLSSPLYS